MRDVELYRAILGLTPPWRIVAVDLDVPGQQVTVKADAGPGPFPCPECQELVPGYDRNLRRWRHLEPSDTLEYLGNLTKTRREAGAFDPGVRGFESLTARQRIGFSFLTPR